MIKETLYGRHPVLEALRAGRRSVLRVLLARDLVDVEELAAQRGVPVERVERGELDRKAKHHQGVVAVAGPYPYSDQSEIVGAEREHPVVLILDLVQDPQNLGVVLRTAEATGVAGVLLPRRGAAGVTPAVVSASAGASEHLRIARANLAQTIRTMKGSGFWVAGLEASDEAQDITTVDLRPPLALVVGSEGDGMRRLVRESCDFLVSLPMRGRVGSLNAAVAGSIALFEVQRRLAEPSREP